MFDIHKISLFNFRCYRGDVEFTFPTEPGVYFFTGENNTALGSNGSGKSSLLDAIAWALYGRTLRGLKAGEVVSWGATSCSVELELTLNETRVRIKRTQKPNNIFINDEPVDQQVVEDLLRLNYDSFVSSIVNPQFGEAFLALSPAIKLGLFSDIMNLGYWLEKSEEAALEADSLKLQIAVLVRTIDAYEAQVAAINADLATYAQADAVFINNKKVRLTLIKREIGDLERHTSIENLPKISESLNVKLTQAERARDIWLDHVTKDARDRSKILGKTEALREQIAEFSKLEGECPTCNQRIDKTTAASHLKKLLHQISICEWHIRAIDADLEMDKKELVRAKLKIEQITSELEECRDQEAHEAITRNEIASLREKHRALKNEINPYTALLKHKQENFQNLKYKIATDTKTKQEAEATYEALSFWIKGFKRVRLFLIEEAFRTLEIEVNNSLAQLGMPDWQITFDIERENKSGGITKGFVVFVKSPANTEPVRWENWSGGETQRLQLAGYIGLSNLILQQAGLYSCIEFYDEPSTHLSTEGMLDLANLLHERAIAEGKRIWIVDHSAVTNFGDFKGVITVKRTENGSSVAFRAN